MKDLTFIVGSVVVTVIVSALIASMLVGCTFIELNMVQRAIIEDGDGIASSHRDKAVKQESDSMKLIVPIK